MTLEELKLEKYRLIRLVNLSSGYLESLRNELNRIEDAIESASTEQTPAP